MLPSSILLLPLGAVLRALTPESPQARAIFDLGVVATIIFAAILVIVAGIIVYALMRFRWREGEPDPPQLAGNSPAFGARLKPAEIDALVTFLQSRTNRNRPAEIRPLNRPH